MAMIYYDSDAQLEILRDKTIAIIGYGNQGRAQALNMRDSGIEGIVIGGRQDEYLDRAAKEGFKTASVEEACNGADIILFRMRWLPLCTKARFVPGLRTGLP